MKNTNMSSEDLTSHVKSSLLILFIFLSNLANAKSMEMKSYESERNDAIFKNASTLNFFQQTKVVKGKVKDENGQPLVGVNITVKNKSLGTTTDTAGNFSLNIQSNQETLVFTLIGYATKELLARGGTTLSVTMTEQENSLSSIVVIGYGTARKKDVTGAVSNLSAKDFNTGTISNPMQQLAGKVPGLTVTQPSGDPNQNVTIRLRGQTSLTGNQSPLILVDGVPLPDPGLISTISPSDIISYDVLKDAAASAIYGARGANGVILISTKKGRNGKAQIDYSGSFGIEKNAKKYDLLNAQQFIDAGGTSSNAATAPYNFTLSDGNTDWIDEITQTGTFTNHNLGISGGTENFNYRGSVNYLNQKGIVLNSSKEMYGMNLSMQQKALDNRLVINLGINSNRVKRNLADGTALFFALLMPPTAPVYDKTGGYYGFFNIANQSRNPLPLLTMQKNQQTEQTNLWSASADYDLLKGFKFGVSGSMFSNIQRSFGYSPLMPAYNPPTWAYQNNYNNDSYRGELHFNYLRDFGKHSINATAVYEFNHFSSDSFGANGSYYLYDPVEWNNLGGGNPTLNGIGSGKSAYRLISFLGRAMYNYDTRYYLTASLRRDGSSKFGINNQWGYFPSVSAAWRISREKFMKDISWINELKLSAGLGNTGNADAISPYLNLLLLGTSGGRYYNPATPQFEYQPSYGPIQNANPDLKWETRQGFNLQLDFSLFNNRLSGNINRFDDKTKNMLFNYSVPVPPFFVSNIWANVGTITNKGWEFQLNGDIIRQADFKWNMGGQMSLVKTKVESLSGTYNGYDVKSDHVLAGQMGFILGVTNNPLSYLQVGYAPYTFYLPHYVGLDDKGLELFDDGKGGQVGKNGLTTDMNRYIDPSPKFTYGITNSFSYKGWDLNFFLRGIQGVKYFNATRMLIDNVVGLSNSNVSQSGLNSGDKDTRTVSDKWIENGSFLRLDNATLGYTFNSTSKHIDHMRFFVTGNNLFVISKYRGLDPEIQVTGNYAYTDINIGGSDTRSNNSYFKTRSFSIGVVAAFK